MRRRVESVAPSVHPETPLATHYVLIDFENVQPRNLELLTKHPFKVFVFVGANQTKVPFDLADSMQLLGNNARYIKISGNGQNALDFHIAYYVGELAAKDPDAHFHVISKDKGFDQLIKHLNSRQIRIQREKDLAEIPLLRVSNKTSSDEKIAAIVEPEAKIIAAMTSPAFAETLQICRRRMVIAKKPVGGASKVSAASRPL